MNPKIQDKNKKIAKKIKQLKEEIKYLNILLSDCDEGSWDLKAMYKDFRYGTFGGNEIEGFKPDKKLATWFANRWDLNEKELEQ